MVVRVSVFEGGDDERLRELNEDRMRSGDLGFPAGVQRVLVISTGQGKRMLLTFFEDRDAAAAADAAISAMGDDIPEEARGRRTSVDVYDVLFDQQL
jgi:hypothetical protein